MIAAYNAGPSRAAEWNKVPAGQTALRRGIHKQHRNSFDARLRHFDTRALPQIERARAKRQSAKLRIARALIVDACAKLPVDISLPSFGSQLMTTIYSAQWIVPVSSPPFAAGGIAVERRSHCRRWHAADPYRKSFQKQRFRTLDQPRSCPASSTAIHIWN